MSDIRELLELAARVMGLEIEPCTCTTVPFRRKDTREHWQPDEESGDCANMCAALGINTVFIYQACNIVAVDCACLKPWVQNMREEIASHNNNRSAAWRMAALRVAAAIGAEHE